MPDPVSYEEYVRLSMENTVIGGFGLDMETRVPCPFCAHPDFMRLLPVAGIIPGDDRPTLHETLATEHACEGCGRSAKAIVQKDDDGVRFEIVQTGGPDPADWLTPKPRRVEP